ncbi:MAG: aminotransferase class IV [Acidimicrobiales bacterium]|nr:aminotransferase class IV [Acidimicrobiales bacterium]
MAEPSPSTSSDSSLHTSWINGELVPHGEAALRADDHAVVVGDGVFETTKVIDGVPFALSRHLRRLRQSALGLRLKEPSEDLIRSAIDAVVKANPDAGLLRITWSSGSGPLGSGRGEGPGTLVVSTSGSNSWPTAERAHLVPWARNEHGALTGLKTTSYAENVLALATAREAECSEALFLNTAGLLCEGTGTNVFLVIGGSLVTPPLSSGCLAGITRELILEITRQEMHGKPPEDVEVRNVDPHELLTAEEAFLTSATRNVSAISEITGKLQMTFNSAPGPVTTRVAAAFSELESHTVDP